METGSAGPGTSPDSQPRRVRKGRRGLLGFLDDLRTRVKPTRGVLDLPWRRHPKTDADPEDKRGIIADTACFCHCKRSGANYDATPIPVKPRQPMPDQDALFNHAQPARPGLRRQDVDPPVRDVCVVGGGTAGWMTALLLADSAFGARLRVTVLESPSVGIIGVGEGSTPWLKDFFDRLGIAESTWMPACNATYKSGISFDGWSTRPGFERYFHPFPSTLDNHVMRAFGEHAHARLGGVDLPAHPDRFFVSAAIARQCRAPRGADGAPCSVRYGYHFDSTLLGAFLREEAGRRGVTHVARHMTRALLSDDGAIRAVELADGGTLEAGFWVDCSGFASLLATQALKI